jgi:hypothetical protein
MLEVRKNLNLVSEIFQELYQSGSVHGGFIFILFLMPENIPDFTGNLLSF